MGSNIKIKAVAEAVAEHDLAAARTGILGHFRDPVVPDYLGEAVQRLFQLAFICPEYAAGITTTASTGIAGTEKRRHLVCRRIIQLFCHRPRSISAEIVIEPQLRHPGMSEQILPVLKRS